MRKFAQLLGTYLSPSKVKSVRRLQSSESQFGYFQAIFGARQQLAALYENQQRYFEAQLQYQQLLAVAPDDLLAITRLQALSQLNLNPVQSVDVPPVTLLDPDVESIIANAPDAGDYPNADTLVLFNHFSHDVLPTGQSRYTTHQVVKNPH